jgi:endonuclease III-like uncharacterized protein
VKTADYFLTRAERINHEAGRHLESDHEHHVKTALMRDVLKVLEGTGHESAAKVLRGVFGEYE